jgi:hypothetical protein
MPGSTGWPAPASPIPRLWLPIATTAAEHLFALRQNLELFDTIQRQIQDCDGEIESLLQKLAPKQRKSARARASPRYKFRHCDNEPRFDVRDPLFRLSGVDLTQIDGIGPFTALRLIAEIGTDMSRWQPTNTSPRGSPLPRRTRPLGPG